MLFERTCVIFQIKQRLSPFVSKECPTFREQFKICGFFISIFL